LDERVKFAILSAGVDFRREVFEELRVKLAANPGAAKFCFVNRGGKYLRGGPSEAAAGKS